MANTHISIQQDDFDPGQEVLTLCEPAGAAGACVSFLGLVRDLAEQSEIRAMTLEHYPGMTERALQRITDEAQARWRLLGVRVIHRVGRLLPGERIVLVAVTSAHRGEAFAACEFIMDWLKTRAPFWKKEETPDGARWVDARDSDSAAAQRWGEIADGEN